MTRKLLSAFSVFFVLLMAGGTALATGTGESSGYDAVTYDDTIGFSAVLQEDGSVKATWSKYDHAESFTYYKLVRSQENDNPVYPDDGYIYYGGDIDGLSYTDADVPEGFSWYRICQIASPKRYCSKTVVMVDSSGGLPSKTEGPAFIDEPEYVTDEGTVQTRTFIDVPFEHFAESCLEDLAKEGIVQSGEGYEEYRPAYPVNRAEFLKIVMKAYYPESSAYDGDYCFDDVGGDDWFAPFICTAKSAGIVAGYTDNTYRPVKNITRAEGAAILVKALHIPLMSWEGVAFTDVSQSWQKEVVGTSYLKGLVNGYSDTKFGPNNLLTRAEAAKLVCNARENFVEPLEGDVPVIGATETSELEEEPAVSAGQTVTVVGSVSRSAPLIINHLNTAIVSVPDDYVATAKASFKIAYGHTSHGSQIVTGMGVLEGSDALYSYSADGSGGSLYLNESLLSGDLGGDWETQTRSLLENNTQDINMVMWSWCGQLSSMSEEDVNSYLQAMNALEEDFPDVVFVYMTGHLDGSGTAGTLHRNNEMIRTFARNYNKVLFDFADIESYDPAGAYYLDRDANDNNDYDGGNWAQNWCSANSGSALCATNSCAHSQPLNCNIKARAFWWMMARLAGWGG
jgi:hypothetical protein